MTMTLSYVTILKGGGLPEQDAKLRLLVKANIDCFIDEKQNLVVHPDQYERAKTVLNKNL